ncbi:hypothetical protein N7G274_006903 [Stereocaulon virgatum]|uniref:STEEP1 domain-containing protein n=1 Tax=Stereocaulon virgatum TaxID=373712 RepID=A0ABR4A3M0_9LECA
MSHPLPPLKTYHCLCSTLLLATPYTLSHLPRRAPPSLDRAYILPLPSLSSRPPPPATQPDAGAGHGRENEAEELLLPSLLTQNLRPARKLVIVRRDDGFEKRRVFRCGRCGVCVGYEVLGDKEGKGTDGREKVVYLLEGGMVETGEMEGGVASG